MKRNTLIALFLLFVPLSAIAEEKTVGDYVVNYSVFNSTILPPAMATLYDVVRAGNRILVNISLRRKTADGGSEPHAASVTGTNSDLMRKHPLAFRELREQQAIYYIADFRISREENRVFRIEVLPEGEYQPIELRFSKKLYADD